MVNRPVPPDPHATFAALQRRRHLRTRLILRDAREFKALFEAGAHLELGYASLGDLAEDLGYSADEGRRLYSLARVLEWMPGLESLLFSGRVNVEKAAALARLLDTPGAIRERDTWLLWMERDCTSGFQRRVNRRVEETLRGEAVEKVSFWLTQKGVEDFRRCRGLLSRRAERRVTRGEALEEIASYFLQREDPLAARPGERRVGETGEIRSRYIPIEVRRAVRARAGERCEAPWCTFDTWLDYAHIVPHRLGGSREADNLLLLCGRHHGFVDDGILKVRVSNGQVEFVDPWGRAREGPRIGPPVVEAQVVDSS